MLVITHYQRLLDYIVPDFVHVLVGRAHRALGRQGAGARARGEGLRLARGRRRRERRPTRPPATGCSPSRQRRPSAADAAFVSQLRADAPGRASPSSGLPTTKREEWRYTNARRAARRRADASRRRGPGAASRERRRVRRIPGIRLRALRVRERPLRARAVAAGQRAAARCASRAWRASQPKPPSARASPRTAGRGQGAPLRGPQHGVPRRRRRGDGAAPADAQTPIHLVFLSDGRGPGAVPAARPDRRRARKPGAR